MCVYLIEQTKQSHRQAEAKEDSLTSGTCLGLSDFFTGYDGAMRMPKAPSIWEMPRSRRMYPDSPQVAPQEFFTNQYGLPCSSCTCREASHGAQELRAM
jgi:hypothetical protein